MNGLLLLDKPAGPTSAAALAGAKKALGAKKAGHAGTLDPQATGLLVLAFGEATRWLPYLPSDKRYVAGIRFGLETDTEDVWGRELARKELKAGEGEIRAVLESLQGLSEQVPPMVSALKRDGKPLYEYAREGVELERRARKVEIYGLKVLKVDGAEAEFEVHCGSGTYVRSLCAEAGRRIGSGACMSSLRRTQVGPFRVEDADPARLLGPEEALAHLKEYKVPKAEETHLSQGRDLLLPQGDYKEGEAFRLNSLEGKLLGLGAPAADGRGGWKMHPERVFSGA
jgi:tRNA pseudouridine55 synthase